MYKRQGGQQLIKSSSPEFDLQDTGASANVGRWRQDVNDSGTWTLKSVNDAISDSNDAISITRSGYVPQYVNFPNGNVGIGTDQPKDLLEVNDNTSTAKVRIMGTGATTADLLLGGATHTNASVGIRHYSTGSGIGHLSFLTSSTDGALSERVRINSSGNALFTGNISSGLAVTDTPIGKIHANDGGGGTLTLTRTASNTDGLLGQIRFRNTNTYSEMLGLKMFQDGQANSSRLELWTQVVI